MYCPHTVKVIYVLPSHCESYSCTALTLWKLFMYWPHTVKLIYVLPSHCESYWLINLTPSKLFINCLHTVKVIHVVQPSHCKCITSQLRNVLPFIFDISFCLTRLFRIIFYVLKLLLIIRKLFSRPIVASHKIYILLKGQFAINIKPFSVSQAGSYYFVFTM